MTKRKSKRNIYKREESIMNCLLFPKINWLVDFGFRGFREYLLLLLLVVLNDLALRVQRPIETMAVILLLLSLAECVIVTGLRDAAVKHRISNISRSIYMHVSLKGSVIDLFYWHNKTNILQLLLKTQPKSYEKYSKISCHFNLS